MPTIYPTLEAARAANSGGAGFALSQVAGGWTATPTTIRDYGTGQDVASTAGLQRDTQSGRYSSTGNFGFTPQEQSQRVMASAIAQDRATEAAHPSVGGSSFWGTWRRDLLGFLGLAPSILFAPTPGGTPSSGFAAQSFPVSGNEEMTAASIMAANTPSESGVGIQVGAFIPPDYSGAYQQAVNSAVNAIQPAPGLVFPDGNPSTTQQPGPSGVQVGAIVPGFVTQGTLAGQSANPIPGGIVTIQDLQAESPAAEEEGSLLGDILGAAAVALGVGRDILAGIGAALPFLAPFFGGDAAPATDAGLLGPGGGAGAGGGGELLGAGEGPLGFLDKLPLPVKVMGGALLGLAGYAALKKAKG